MSDLIKRAADAARDSRNLDGESVIIGELIDEIERLNAERETWDGHKVCELLRSDLADAIGRIAGLEADIERAFKAGCSAGYSRAMTGDEYMPSHKDVDFQTWKRVHYGQEVETDE